MTDDGGEAGVGDGDGHDARIHAGLAARNGEGVRLAIGKENELPLDAWHISDGGEALADPANTSCKSGIVRSRGLLLVLLKGLQAQLVLLLWRHGDELSSTRFRHDGAIRKDAPEGGESKCEGEPAFHDYFLRSHTLRKRTELP